MYYVFLGREKQPWTRMELRSPGIKQLFILSKRNNVISHLLCYKIIQSIVQKIYLKQ